MTECSYRYQALDRSGVKSKGVMQARDRLDAYRRIIDSGLKPLRITRTRRRGRRKRITSKDLAHFTYQFAVLTEARIPLVDGLRAIADQESNERLRAVLEDLAQRVSSGTNLTEAMDPYRDLFGDVYVETLRAAEHSGNMIEVLNRLALMLEQQDQISRDVRGALMYPLCVTVALVLATLFMMFVAVPRMVAMFESRGVELPLPTLIVAGTSEFMLTYWYVLIGAILVGVVGIRRLWRNPAWRERVDRLLHRVPVLRDILRGLALGRFAHVLGLAIRSGIGLIDALDMSGKSSGRPALISDAEKMKDHVKQGSRFSDVLGMCGYIPTFSRRMLSAGEEAAELSRMCDVVARHYDREVTHLTKNISTVIEPILIVVLAAVVLIIALAMFLPMWNMASLM